VGIGKEEKGKRRERKRKVVIGGRGKSEKGLLERKGKGSREKEEKG
jgi:hypothetical protein